MKRKWIVLLLAALMTAALMLAGCGGSGGSSAGSESSSSGSTSGQEAVDTDDDDDDDDIDDADDADDDDDDDDQDDADDNDADDDDADDDAGWTKVSSAKQAAKGAGLDYFSIPEGAKISLGKIDRVTYMYHENEAQALVDFPASQVRIFKEKDGGTDDLDDYKYTWTQNIKGLVVNCGGNREKEAMKTVWNVDGDSYEIKAVGLGGDDDFGLSADDINSLINGIQ